MFKLLKSSALMSAGLMASSMAFAAIDGAYTEDFESYSATSVDAIGCISGGIGGCPTGSANFLVGANVFDSGGAFLYNYFSFPAPNNTAEPAKQFSGIAIGEGGTNQGLQQLNFFNDYANANHTDGSNNVIHAQIFKEWIIDAADLDKTWVFRYSYKSGSAVAGTTRAIISTIELFSGNFFQTNLVEGQTDDRSGNWVEDVEISLFLDSTIDDVNNSNGAPVPDGVPDLVGQIFQIGFINEASNSSGSGMWYDNLALFAAGGVDTDGDLVDDSVDNCTLVANPGQLDGDGDGHGNVCDADLNNTCGAANFGDLVVFKSIFGTTDPQGDLNDTGGSVNFGDLVAFKALFGTPPGPSAAGLCP
jgi:hypothetical protein